MTNFERIKDMRAEQILKEIAKGLSYDSCDFCPFDRNRCNGVPCFSVQDFDEVEKWLKSEVGE